MSAFAAAEFESDGPEIEIQFVVDDDDVRGIDREESRETGDRATREIHVRAWFPENHASAGEATFDDFGATLLVYVELSAHAPGKGADDHEADVVPGLLVLRAGITQADDEGGICAQRTLLSGLFFLLRTNGASLRIGMTRRAQ
ncbi:hypothetical protein QV65_22650 [Rhodococcus erythropolis]|nr:hypothetical protein QV65_22650 [Rhodococcus erythropolis]